MAEACKGDGSCGGAGSESEERRLSPGVSLVPRQGEEDLARSEGRWMERAAGVGASQV